MSDCAPWPIDRRCLPADWDPDALTLEQQDAIIIASRLLKDASGGWWGPCAVTLRPCRPEAGMVCIGPCGCHPVCRVMLPAPATQIIQVRVNGETLPPASMRIDDDTWLVRTDGTCFPACQRLDLPVGSPDTWSVTYLHGYPIDAAASRAVTALAVQINRDCAGGGCVIDARTTRVTRQGVSYDLTPDSERGTAWLRLPIVAAWLDVVNPGRLVSPWMWWSPEMGYAAQQTSTPAGAGGLELTLLTNGFRVDAVVSGEQRPVWISWGDGEVTST